MVNRILRFFGLVQIRRARYLSRTLHLYYIRKVSKWAKEDFGADIPLDMMPRGSQWWGENFNKMILADSDHVTLTEEEINKL